MPQEEMSDDQAKLERKLAQNAARQDELRALRATGTKRKSRPQAAVAPKSSSMPRAGNARAVTVEAPPRPAKVTPRVAAKPAAPVVERERPQASMPLEVALLRRSMSEARSVIDEATSVLRALTEAAKVVAREAGGEVVIENAGPAPADSGEPG